MAHPASISQRSASPSAKGRPYLSGSLGKSRVVAFAGGGASERDVIVQPSVAVLPRHFRRFSWPNWSRHVKHDAK